MSHHKRTLGAMGALMSIAALFVLRADGDRFEVAVDSQDNLLILAPGGQATAQIPKATVGREVKVGDVAFQVSFGRDADGKLTAIFTPPDADSVALHFSAGGRAIDAEKAVVTLTFDSDLKGVTVDPGYVGTVEVDSHLLRPHSLADDLPATPEQVPVPAPAPAPAAAPEMVAAKEPIPNPAPAPPQPVQAPAPAPAVANPPAGAPPFIASQLAPMVPPLGGTAANPPATQAPAPAPSAQPLSEQLAAKSAAPSPASTIRRIKLYWSEPITAPDGSAPECAADEIRLVEVHGNVIVTPPGGTGQAGTEGMVVPSGATVATLDNSTAALFMGGVNSARLMPKCELVVTQTLAASTRSDVIDLHSGAVFSRIGHREGETENYAVTTPEGKTSNPTSDMLAYRGTPGELGLKTAGDGLGFDPKQLLAWNPAPERGLLSDVPSERVGILTPIGGVASTYFYYTGGYRLPLNSLNIRTEVLSNFTPNATPSDTEPDYVLQAVMLMLQPYNFKLNSLLNAINKGTETPAQLTYYHNLVTIFFDQQVPGIVNTILNHPPGFTRTLNIDSAILYQDLLEFKLCPLTPGARTDY